MPRQAQFVIPGVPHHVSQRGNGRHDVFWVADDRRVYLSYLTDSATRHGLAISAYCLMTNHVHPVATPESEDALAEALGRAHLICAQYIRRLHGRLGHFWQSRFYSCPLDEAHAHNATVYVELNPVCAGIAAHPWDYPWSGAGARCGVAGDRSGLLALGDWSEWMPLKEWKATLKTIAKSDDATETVCLHARTGSDKGWRKVTHPPYEESKDCRYVVSGQ